MAHNVVFYDGGCADCQQVAAFFSKHGVEYVRKNLKAHPELRVELERRGVRSLPAVVVDERTITGWNEPALRGALNL
jgi:glutaredoxin